MSQNPELTLPEALVYAAAFAQVYNNLNGEDYTIRIPKAVKAAYDAVDGLRAAEKICAIANERYPLEQKHYNEVILHNVDVAEKRKEGSRRELPRFTSLGTEGRVLELLRAFIESGD